MEYILAHLLRHIDTAVAACLLPLAAWILLSGLDDLVILLAFLYERLSKPAAAASSQPLAKSQKRIAVFVPCWQEHAVIADMVEHNIAAIKYDNYAFFIGAYPNDELTADAVRQLENRFGTVHLCLCPHDGPTSKADCLNWIYQRMLLYEEQHDTRFEVILVHDAEDLIHPNALDWISYYADSYDMIQLPVLPLATPLRDLTHGLYCDDFAECHTKDLPARQALGGFIPSCGVGVGYTRSALQKLADSESNRIFEPACLTEDYENSLRLHRLRCRQLFVPIQFLRGAPVATREYFPRRFGLAIKQRSRWVIGIAFQSWERHGWSGGLGQIYWLWRDRKGLIGSPASLLANILFLCGLATWASAGLTGEPWGLTVTLQSPLAIWLLTSTLVLLVIGLCVRTGCVARIYGWRFASGVPLRAIYGNWLNSVSATLALYRYARARLGREPLVWVKTEHAYPSRAALLPHKRPLEEILTGSGYLTDEQLAMARATKPRGLALTHHLVQVGLLSEEELYEALSLQLGLALEKVDPNQVPRNVARTLPAHIVRQWHVLPVQIESGNLLLASPEFPSDELSHALRKFTHLEIRVRLVTPTNFRLLEEQLL